MPFKVESYNSYNSQKDPKTQFKYFSSFDINNEIISETFDDYLLRMNNGLNNEDINLNSIINDNFEEENQSLKLVNFPFFQKNIELILNEKEKLQDKLKAGRKKKNSYETGNHNKYTSDNIIRKCKTVLINVLFNFINKKIKDIYKKSLENSLNTKKLMKMNQSQIINSRVKYNQSFLYKTLKEIFSENLSLRCSKYKIDHNKNLINELLNEKDKIKQIFFNDLFSLTFLDCINHFRGSKNIYCLEGLPNYNEICQNLNGDDDYKESFKCYIDNFENIIKNKKSRKSNKDANNKKNDSNY
jgi:hypothetical protein